MLRFNFRGVGRSAGTWDNGKGETGRLPRRAGLHGRGPIPVCSIWAAGFSFGSYIALTAGAADPRVCALIGIAPPVDRYDFDAALQSSKPKFVVHGERDELISLRSVREFYARMQEPKELVEIDMANHLFDGQASEVGDALRDLLTDFSCAKP